MQISNTVELKTNLRTKVRETAWPGSDSVSPAALITLTTATMKAQLWPWQ